MGTSTHAAPPFRLHRAVGLLAIVASAVAGEYGAGINFVAVQSLSVYPAIRDLVPLAMLVTGLLVLPKVFLYQRFSQVMPRAGSAYVWIGRSLDGGIAFALGVIWWLGLCGSIGFLSFAFGTFLGQACNAAGLAVGAWLLSPTGHVIAGLAAIWAILWLHATGVHRYGAFVVTLFVLILLTAGAIVAYGFLTPSAVFLHLAAARAGVTLAAPSGTGSPSLAAFGAVCALFIFAYGGISAAPALGGETREAETTMPRGLVIGWAVAVVLFSAVAYALFHAAPWWAMLALIHAHKEGFATAPGLMGLIAPPVVSTLLNFAVAVIVGKTIAPALLVNSRLLFAFAQDRLLPERFVATSEAKVPLAGLVLTACVGSVFLIQSAYIGWAIGVVVRALSILLVWLGVALGALAVSFGIGAASREEWARQLRASPFTIPAALVSVVITVYLMSTVIVVPHTKIWFQPIFQSLLAVLIAVALLIAARGRAHARGERLRETLRAVPRE